MPVSHKFAMNIGIVGVRADAEYGSSVRYLEVKPNKALQKPAVVTSDFFAGPAAANEAVTSRNQQKIEEILTKKNSATGIGKTFKDHEKRIQRIDPDSIRNSLEVKDNTTKIVDENAGKRQCVLGCDKTNTSF